MKEKVILPTVKVVLWVHSTNTEGKHPVKIRITDNRKHQYFHVLYEASNSHGQKVKSKLFLSTEEYQLIHLDRSKALRGLNKEMRHGIDASIAKAQDAIVTITRNNKPYTQERFSIEYLGDQSVKGFLALFKHHLDLIKKDGRIGTYNSYNAAYIAFNKFRGGSMQRAPEGGRKKVLKPGKELQPIDLTSSVLKNFEMYLKDHGAGRTTIGIYMRAMKVIYNLATDINPSLREFYPFATRQTERNKYKIKTGSGHKGQALTVEQLQNFINTETVEGTQEDEAKQIWLFSFHCQGMNMKDISLLKYSDISGDSIRYIREKTKDTEEKETVIEIPLTDSIRKIISSIGNPDKRKSAYVFGIVQPAMDLERQTNVIKQKTKMVNERLRTICDANELPTITTYWARHSYASLLKESGESIEMIRELLGHSDIRTTENYLKRFDINLKRKANERIAAMVTKITA